VPGGDIGELNMDRFDLGAHSRPVSTASPEAQKWFDLGLNWCFGFNQEEGVKCFRKALECDPDCMMAHWGIAYGAGPFYNLPWRDFGREEADTVTALAFSHIGLARGLFDLATPVEQYLVEALSRRFQKPHAVPPEEFDRWDDDYAAEMRRVYYEHPDDHDVMALFVEALITRTPRRLWDVRTGLPERNSDVLEALRVCERSIALKDAAGQPQHPAIVHMHIHALEMSNHPEDAMRSANILETLCPDAGHMTHMPGHIHVLCGDYEKARLVSEKAIVADNMYADYAGSFNFYITARCHDLHLMMFTCMFLGQYGPALEAANTIRRILPREILAVQGRPKLALTTEGYYSMKMHVLVRFGQWQAILDEPLPDEPELYLVSTAMQHYARGIAYATLKDITAAERERSLFFESLQRIPTGRRFLSNYAHATLGVGEKMLEGELEYHKGNYEAAFPALRESVRRDDNLGYTEPWAWMHPPRHALAALLAEQGHYAEAEEVYRDDLGLSGRVQRCTQHPDNVWALHGIVECLERRGEQEEYARLRRKLDNALARVDVPITSSCMCRTTAFVPAHPGCCSCS
jgi:tetratricopeptide (TPR) repeat protein